MIAALLTVLFVQSAPTSWMDSRPTLDWTLVSVGERTMGFMKPGPSPRLKWLRVEMREPSQYGTRSQISLVEYDCAGGRSRPVQHTSFTGPNMTGTTEGSSTGEASWRYPTPGSVGETQFNWACSR